MKIIITVFTILTIFFCTSFLYWRSHTPDPESSQVYKFYPANTSKEWVQKECGILDEDYLWTTAMNKIKWCVQEEFKIGFDAGYYSK